MKTHKEMLKLVLEAFKLIAAQNQGCGGNVSEAEAWRSAQSIALANITIIKEALEQSKEHLPNMSEINRTIAYSAAATLHELGYEWKEGEWVAQQKEPEQEPLGHFYFDEGQWKQARDPISFSGCTKLYKAPQRKPLTDVDWKARALKAEKAVEELAYAGFQRKPLTDERIVEFRRDIVSQSGVFGSIEWCSLFARAIEAAHGIKE